MRLLLDQNVPNSVATVFENRGHAVLYLREITDPSAPDIVVAAISEIEEAILVSADGDFRKIAPRVPDGQRKRFRKLSRITLRCNAPQTAQRVSEAMSLIESEYEIAQGRHDPRMIIVIGNSYIRTER